MAELVVRLVFSLAVVVGLLLLTVKVGGRKFRGRNGAVVRVLHRQPLSRSSAVAVVEVGSRILVLGTTDHQVNVLAELDEDELATGELIELDTLGSNRTELQSLTSSAPATPLTPSTPATRLLVEEAPAEAAAAPYTGAGKRRATSSPTRAARTKPARGAQVRPTKDGALVGSILSPQTWRQALAAASGRAS
jgi:flagellar protein FliO/FliZ